VSGLDSSSAYLHQLEEEIRPGSCRRAPTAGRRGWRPPEPSVPATAARILGGGDRGRLLGSREGREVPGGRRFASGMGYRSDGGGYGVRRH
jgi:hypothetical protein